MVTLQIELFKEKQRGGGSGGSSNVAPGLITTSSAAVDDGVSVHWLRGNLIRADEEASDEYGVAYAVAADKHSTSRGGGPSSNRRNVVVFGGGQGEESDDGADAPAGGSRVSSSMVYSKEALEAVGLGLSPTIANARSGHGSSSMGAKAAVAVAGAATVGSDILSVRVVRAWGHKCLCRTGLGTLRPRLHSGRAQHHAAALRRHPAVPLSIHTTFDNKRLRNRRVGREQQSRRGGVCATHCERRQVFVLRWPAPGVCVLAQPQRERRAARAGRAGHT